MHTDFICLSYKEIVYPSAFYYEHEDDLLDTLYNIDCVGVERRLLDCPFNSGLGVYDCNTIVGISVNNGNNFLHYFL